MTRSGEVQLFPPTFADILHVCSHMRASDRAEAHAVRFDPSPVSLAREFFLVWPTALIFHVIWAADRSEPIALLLIVPTSAGSAEVSMIATDRFPEVALSLTRHILRKVRPYLMELGLRRLECRALESHSSARQWLRILGAREEALIIDGGKSGETLVQIAWRKSDVHRR